jgi:hypothetical protein
VVLLTNRDASVAVEQLVSELSVRSALLQQPLKAA